MYKSILTVALLSSTAFASPEKRQATNVDQFTKAADQLISAYLPTSVVPGLISIVSEAAAKASVTGDAASLLTSALLAKEIPGWFTSAIPSEWSKQFGALESGINGLRGTVGATDLVPFVVAVTTTDSAGKTFTTDITTTVPASLTGVWTTVATDVVDGVTSVYSTVIDGGASIASKVINGASSVASDIASGGSSVAGEITSGASSVFGEVTSGASSVLGEITSGAGSILSEATAGASSVVSNVASGASSVLNAASSALGGGSTSTSRAGAAMVTAAAGGALGLMGLMIAL